MLQTIRDFAREKMDRDEEEALRLHAEHAAYFAAFARQVRHGFEGNGQLEWMRRGGQEDGNMEAALDSLRLAAEGGNAEAVETGLQACGDLILYWHVRAQHVRMKTHVDGFLKVRTVEGPTAGWVAAMNAVSLVAVSMGDAPKATELSEAAYQGAQALGDERDLAQLPWYTGTYYLFAGDMEKADELLALGVDRSRALGWEWSLAFALSFHGILASATGKPDEARARLKEALEIQKRIGDYEGMGVALSGMAQLAMGAGDLDESLELYERAKEAMATVGDRPEVARIMDEMAWCTLAASQVDRARRLFLGSLQAHDSVASTRGMGLALFGLSAVEVASGRADRGAVIAAAAEVFAEAEGVVVTYPWVTAAQDEVAAALRGLSPEELERCTQEGRRMSVQEAVAYATGAPLEEGAALA
jgi:tetratricopeptide (TPR) repeat protein